MTQESESAVEGASAENSPKLPSFKNPELVDVLGGEAMRRVTFEDATQLDNEGRPKKLNGFYSGRYFLSDGQTEVQLIAVRTHDGKLTNVEVVNGKRTAPFALGEAVRMPRKNNAPVDKNNAPVDEVGWKVINVSENEAGVPMVKSGLMGPDDEPILTKNLPLSELRRYNVPQPQEAPLDDEVAAAHVVVGIEKAIDEHSAEMADKAGMTPEASTGTAEHEPPVDDVVEELGDKGVEASGIQEPQAEPEPESESSFESTPEPAPVLEPEPEPESAPEPEANAESESGPSELDQIKAIYERQSEAVLHEADRALEGVAGRLGSAYVEFTAAQHKLVEQVTEDALAKLEGVLRHHDDYPIGALRTVMQETSHYLQDALNKVKRFDQQAVHDVERVLTGVDDVLTPFGNDAQRVDIAYEEMTRQVNEANGDQSLNRVEEGTAAATIETAKNEIGPTDEILQGVRALSEGLQQVGHYVVAPQIDYLESIIKQSYNYPIDINDLIGLIARIRNAAQWGDINQGIRKTVQDLDGLGERIVKARRVVAPQ